MSTAQRLIGVLLALVGAGMIGATPHVAHATPDTDALRIQRGFQIAPVPLNLTGLNRDLVGLGSYIVNSQGGCNDCHTSPSYAVGGDPFLGQPKHVNKTGYLAGGAAFGPFISANITPDAKRRPAGLTLAQFVNVLRTGRDPDNAGRLLQVMPWPAYQDMRYHDIEAIYTYLQAIPSRPGHP